ncbi:hypothetical protein WJ969_13805 [Achromobacter xylosoxidans]
MDLLQTYPVSFIVTVILPIVSGLVLAVGGYDSLKARADSDAQLTRIERNTEHALEQLPDVNATLTTLSRYERALTEFGHKDDVLAAVLIQYQRMKRASEAWDRMRASTNHEEKAKLASEVLDVLSKNLAKVDVPDNLPSKPLLLGLAPNVFRVLFDVPMRIPPRLSFKACRQELEQR